MPLSLLSRSTRFRQAAARVTVAVALIAGSAIPTLTHAEIASAGVSLPTGVKAVEAAATRQGKPYRYGANGPSAFDCSGLTQWTYARVGKSLPRTSNEQYRATQRVSWSQRKQGDLVFFMSGSRVYHVGIYADNNTIWHSPKPGKSVKREKIWTKNLRLGRVR
ncbi:MAG: C40 family peptidase [Actinomycetota bacterium]